MIDYRGLEALYTVQKLQSFEAAAKKLNITQSAISQRIKALESAYGEPLLIRILPYKTTKLGEHLIGHYQCVCLLEDSLKQKVISSSAATKPHMSIAINRDSLESWFLDMIEEEIFQEITLEVIADDQELTLEYLRKGLVSACVSTSSKGVLGGKVSYLGAMDYILAASPQFILKYFSERNQKKCLREAPAIKFDKNDYLHERYLERFFGIHTDEWHGHLIPSVCGFKKFALLGLGYGLIPRIDILKELHEGSLVQLYPEKVWKIELYWHCWDITSQQYNHFNAEIIKHASRKLQRH